MTRKDKERSLCSDTCILVLRCCDKTAIGNTCLDVDETEPEPHQN